MTGRQAGRGPGATGWLPWRAVWRQSWRDAGALAVGAVAIALAAFLSSAVPQLAGAVATSAVRAAVADPVRPVEVVVGLPFPSGYPPDPDAAEATAMLVELVEAGMPADLRGVLADPVTALVGPELKAGVVAGRRGLVRFAYLAGPSGPEVSWVAGAPPVASGDPTELASGKAPLPVEVGVSEAAAELLGLGPGAQRAVTTLEGGAVDIRVSGVYRAVDAGDPAWAVAPTLVSPQLVGGAEAYASVGLLLSADSLPFAQAAVFPSQLSRTITYPVAAARLDAASAAQVAAQVRSLASGRDAFEIRVTVPVVTTGLDRVIDETLGQVAVATAQASVLLVGVLAVALLVEFLAAALVVERRAQVIAQWRARGASLPAIGLAFAVEAVLVTAVAGAVGVAAAGLVAGGVPPPGWVLPPLLLALLPGPLLAVRAAEAARPRPAITTRGRLTPVQLRRVAAGTTLVVLAVAALATLAARGATASAGAVWSDAVVLAAPVLVALAVGLGLVRLQARVAAPARSLAGHGSGVVPLLVAARVRGAGPALATLVVATTVAALAASAAATVRDGRTDAAWDAVGADVAVTTTASAGLPVEIAGLDGDGLTVATAAVIPNVQLLGQGLDRSVTVLAVDAEALERLLAVTPAPNAPGLARLATAGPGPAPVLAADLPGWDEATIRWGDELVTTDSVGNAPALPRQLVPGKDGTVVVDRAVLARALGREVPAGVAWLVGPAAEDRVREALGDSRAVVVTRVGWVTAQASAPLAQALDWLFAGAAAVSTALAALAVVLMVATGAQERDRAAARLRVLGTPRPTAARVAWLEIAVPAVMASVVGLAVGTGLAVLLVGALDLGLLTGGRLVPRPVVEWWVVALPIVLGLVARLAAAVSTSRWRRARLGQVLRAG